MRADQAIFTSMNRRGGMSGYHLVSRSSGITEHEVRELTRWSPSHDALISDQHNSVSVNLHSLSTERLALSRTCQGPAEYSGRGGSQLYTHILVFDLEVFEAVHFRAMELYWDCLALGLWHYQHNPEAVLPLVELPRLHRPIPPKAWERRAADLGLPPLQPLVHVLRAGGNLQYVFAGNRIALAECLIGLLPPKERARLSFCTSLKRSVYRPYRLCLLGGP